MYLEQTVKFRGKEALNLAQKGHTEGIENRKRNWKVQLLKITRGQKNLRTWKLRSISYFETMITTDNLGQVWWCPPRAICSSHTPRSLCSTTLEMSGLMIPAQGYLSQPESLVFVLQTTETWSGRTRNSKSLTKLLLRVECLHLQNNSWRCTNIFCDHIICNLYLCPSSRTHFKTFGVHG